MLTVPDPHLQALGAGYHLSLVGEVVTGGKSYDLSVADYTVTADESRAERYGCDLTLSPDTDPTLLRPYGARLRLWHRLNPPGLDAVDVPAGVLRLTGRQSRLPDGEIQISGVGLETIVDRDTFTAPHVVQGGSTLAVIRELIRQSVPDALFDVRDVADKRLRKVVYEQDRWGAIRADDNSLARSIAAVVFCDAGGRWRIQPAPRLRDEPVWTVAEGDGGALVSIDDELTDANVRNVWVIEGQRTDDAPTGRAVVMDDDRDSPTYARGVSDATGDSFGRYVEHVSTPLVESDGDAREYGEARLATSTGLSESLSLTAIPHPGLEVGDVIETTSSDGTVSKRIVSSIRWGSGTMDVSTRVVRRTAS